MHILVFGATGRVGTSVVEQAAAAGHQVTAFVRDPSRLKAAPRSVRTATGDIYKADTVASALGQGIDAVVVVVGADPLKRSTVVSDTARAIVPAMKSAGVKRYLGITGTAEMPRKSVLGELSTAVLRMTPVGHAAHDHDAAYLVVSQSSLEWTLAGCPYIKDGPTLGQYQTSSVFPGGFKTIHPGDVAHFLVGELEARKHPNQVVGIWY